MRIFKICIFILPLLFIIPVNAQPTDTTIIFTPSDPDLVRPQSYEILNSAWGADILLSNNGFGLGGFYRHETSDDFSWIISLAFSDVKDDAEFERYDQFGYSYTPGKKNRLLMIPFTLGIQYRLFRNDITDNFQPFFTAGLGPTMMLVCPYVHDNISYDIFGNPYREKIDFFTSLKYGKFRYSAGGFIGCGAYFGMESGKMTGLSIKYFLTRYPDGIEVMYGGYTKNFGGLFITLSFTLF